MITKIKSKIVRNTLNIIGFKTKRKLIVIESDDWGTIRTASKESLEFLLTKGYPVDKNPYNKYDALESNKDLECLFEVLSSVSDKNGNPAKITANNIVANPDFDKIKASSFQEYFYEPFTDTLKKYPSHDRVMDLYREGISSNLIQPQFHGREHLNVNRWITDLKEQKQYLLDAFEQNMFSLHWKNNNEYANEYMDAYDCDSQNALNDLEPIINDGITIFNSIWGFESKSIIANCYIWSKEIEPIFKKNKIDFIQGLPIQFEPKLTIGQKYKKRFHYTGQKNNLDQIYLVRNVFFEPSVYPKKDFVDDCLNRINLAFKYKNPVIISSHRLNFIGSIYEDNRTKNLILFKQLLKKIVQKWPDVEFISSDELGQIIKNK
jgi:hypothetical protein